MQIMLRAKRNSILWGASPRQGNLQEQVAARTLTLFLILRLGEQKSMIHKAVKAHEVPCSCRLP